MYESFYQFQEKPFSLLPDPRFLFHSAKHDMALAKLKYGLLNQAGFTVISGGIGTGKTTVIRHMLNHLERDLTVGLINNTHGAFGHLLDWISMAFSLPREGKDNFALFYQFMDFIISEYAAGRRTVLIVDEAQNMPVDMLEELRVISNINADRDQVLQIILVGQTELEETLRHPGLVQFAQRIAVHFALTPLTKDETAGYIRHRLEVAGGHAGLFEPAAIAEIHRYSGGVPRLINALSHAALVCGFAAGRPAITAVLVHEAAKDKQNSGLLPLAATVPDNIDEMVKTENANCAELAAKAPPPVSVLEAVMDSVPKPFDVEEIPAVHGASAEKEAEPASDVPRMSESDTDSSGSSAVQPADEKERDRPNGAESKGIASNVVAAAWLMVALAAGLLWLVIKPENPPNLAKSSVVTREFGKPSTAHKGMPGENNDGAAAQGDAQPPAVNGVAIGLPTPSAPAVWPATDESSQPLSRGQKASASGVSPDERITELLLLAGEALQEYRLMIPAKRNAYNYYQQVLSLEPGNAHALDGLGQIVERYIFLARRSIQRQNNVRARQYIARGLRVRPGDGRLLALRDSMNPLAVNVPYEHQAAAVMLESWPEETKQPATVYQRLKGFFVGN